MIESTQRIGKRLGPERTRDAITAIQENRMEEFIKLVLVYYDKTYQNGLSKRNNQKVFSLEMENTDTVAQVEKVLNFTGALPALV